MGLNVTNCPKCGKLMVKGPRAVCPQCLQLVEEQYEKCIKYLRENRKCSLQELSEATGVSSQQITKFIREGRISIAGLTNMTYECEVCGTGIREGHLCDSCRKRLVRDVKDMREDERRRAQMQQGEGTGFLKDR